MLAENLNPASQTGEDQSSSEFAARSAHWIDVQAGLTAAMSRNSPASREGRDAAMLSDLVKANDLLDAEHMEYTIDGRTIRFSDLITAEDVVLIMSERAQKLFGPNADGYPGVNKLQKGILDGALRGWIALCCTPDCLGGDQDAGASGAVGGGQ